MRSSYLFFTLLFAGSVSAATIDFEGATGGFDGLDCYDIESDGFRFYGGYGLCPELRTLTAPDSTQGIHVITYEDSAYLMESLSGESFTLSSLDVISLGSYMSLTGFYANGSTVQMDIGTPSPWTNITLDASWQGLEKVEFFMASSGFGASIDNLVVTAVPLPPAVWLFGSALAGLGWLRRKQTA